MIYLHVILIGRHTKSGKFLKSSEPLDSMRYFVSIGIFITDPFVRSGNIDNIHDILIYLRVQFEKLPELVPFLAKRY